MISFQIRALFDESWYSWRVEHDFDKPWTEGTRSPNIGIKLKRRQKKNEHDEWLKKVPKQTLARLNAYIHNEIRMIKRV